MSITLFNRRKRAMSFVLPHAIVCARMGVCQCRASSPNGPRVPPSVHLPALGKVEGLHEAVLDVPQIARARRAGRVRAVRTPATVTNVESSGRERPSRQSRSAAKAKVEAGQATAAESNAKSGESKGSGK